MLFAVALFTLAFSALALWPTFWLLCLRLLSLFKPVEREAELQKAKSKADGDKFDVILVGAGVGGCALAYRLAEMGLKVCLMDQDLSLTKSPPTMIGELMQPAGLHVLKRFGLADCAVEANSQPSYGYCVMRPTSNGRECVDMSGVPMHGVMKEGGFEKLLIGYPLKWPTTITEQAGFGVNEMEMSKLIQEKPDDVTVGRGFHYHTFLRNLRGKCSSHPMISCREVSVTELKEEGDRVIGVQVKESEKTTSVLGALIVVADGGANPKWRRQMGLTAQPVVLSTWAGIALRHKAGESPCVTPCGHIVLTTPSPVIFYRNSPEETRCLICTDDASDVSEKKYPELAACYENGKFDTSRYITKVISPQLPKRFADAIEANADSWRTPGGEPGLLLKNSYCMKLPNRWTKAGVICIGDAFSRRHAITGGGMTVALRDADILSTLIGKEDIYSSSAATSLMNKLIV
eukprot:GHVN01069179.1.p2 GENE.GHVN01069179.1~~GHVN01069179.1.p2  ORF type:complete len:461 (+),score=68.05 GHVN01069179.1:2284-3666(+)